MAFLKDEPRPLKEFSEEDESSSDMNGTNAGEMTWTKQSRNTLKCRRNF